MRVALGYNKLDVSQVRSLGLGITHGEHKTEFPAPHLDPGPNKTIDMSAIWSFGKEIKVDAQIELDRQLIYETCKIGTQEKLRIVLTAFCRQAKFRTSSTIEVLGTESGPVVITAVIPELTCSEVVEFKLSVCVGRQESDIFEVGRPQLGYSSIYDFLWKLNLSGQWSQLDVTSAPFAELHLPSSGLWLISFKNLDEISPEGLLALDASNVISVLLNAAHAEEFGASQLSQTALWSAVGIAGIEKIMNLEPGVRKPFLDLICDQHLDSGDFLIWLRYQFRQAFETLNSGHILYEWEQNRELSIARIQSNKGAAVAKASKRSTGVVVR